SILPETVDKIDPAQVSGRRSAMLSNVQTSCSIPHSARNLQQPHLERAASSIAKEPLELLGLGHQFDAQLLEPMCGVGMRATACEPDALLRESAQELHDGFHLVDLVRRFRNSHPLRLRYPANFGIDNRTRGD